METTRAAAEPSRVLIVDDHAAVRVLLRRLLEGWGYPCAEAEDGVAALEFASTHEVALLVTDLDMPRLDGVGLIRAIRESRRQTGSPGVPVIVVTGYPTERLQAAALTMEIRAVLVKPFETAALRTLVTGILPRTITSNPPQAARRRTRTATARTDFAEEPDDR